MGTHFKMVQTIQIGGGGYKNVAGLYKLKRNF